MRYDAIDNIPIAFCLKVKDMPRTILTPEYLSDALKGVRTTADIPVFAERLGVSATGLAKALRRHGLIIPNGPDSKERKQLPDKQIALAYVAGLSELELAKEHGVSRPAIRRRLIEQGVEIRGGSSANLESAKRLSPEFRKKRAEAAHASLRGKKRSHDELIRRSIAGQHVQCRVGKGEDELYEILIHAGLDARRQVPCDIYNIDTAVGNVAVEMKYGINGAGSMRVEQAKGRTG